MSESEVADHVLAILAPHFHIRREVPGRHFTGRSMRIDAVLTPRDDADWHDCSPALGVEFKAPDKLDGDKAITKWVGQCVDYANTDWSGFGHLTIFMCPGPFGGSSDRDHWMSRMLTRMGVGELRNVPWHGWSFILNQQHRLWSQASLLEDARRSSVSRRFGSR